MGASLAIAMAAAPGSFQSSGVELLLTWPSPIQDTRMPLLGFPLAMPAVYLQTLRHDGHHAVHFSDGCIGGP